MVRELGPVLTGLMVAGRNASGMASELGSMVVTEQIDAMRALGTDPIKKLVTPRVIATVFMLFFLSDHLGDLLGLVGGGLMVAKLFLSLDAREYWTNAWQVLVLQDVFMGLLKPTLFGFIIATVGCYYGMTARGRHARRGPGDNRRPWSPPRFLILVTDFFVTQALDRSAVCTNNAAHINRMSSPTLPVDCTPSAGGRPSGVGHRVRRRASRRLKTITCCAEYHSSFPSERPKPCSESRDRARARF